MLKFCSHSDPMLKKTEKNREEMKNASLFINSKKNSERIWPGQNN